MNVTYRCTNDACDEYGVDKAADQVYDPPPICGHCWKPTTRADPAATRGGEP